MSKHQKSLEYPISDTSEVPLPEAPLLPDFINENPKFPTLKPPICPSARVSSQTAWSLPSELVLQILDNLEPWEQWQTRGISVAFREAAEYLVMRRLQKLRLHLTTNGPDLYSGSEPDQLQGVCDFVIDRFDYRWGAFVWIPHRKRYNILAGKGLGDFRLHVNDLTTESTIGIWDIDLDVGRPGSTVTMSARGNLLVSYSFSWDKEGKGVGEFLNVFIAPERVFRTLKPPTAIKRHRQLRIKRDSFPLVRSTYQEALELATKRAGPRFKDVLYHPSNRWILLDALTDNDVRKGNVKVLNQSKVMNQVWEARRQDTFLRFTEIIIASILSFSGLYIASSLK